MEQGREGGKEGEEREGGREGGKEGEERERWREGGKEGEERERGRGENVSLLRGKLPLQRQQWLHGVASVPSCPGCLDWLQPRATS